MVKLETVLNEKQVTTSSKTNLPESQDFLIKPKIVDTREPEHIRQALLKVGWQQQGLASADYFFFTNNYKKVGIERKELSDLLASIGERIAQQLENMLEYYDYCILLVEGSWSTVTPQQHIYTPRPTFSTWEMVWNFFRTWQHRGITLELTSNATHTVQRLNELYAYYQKSSHTGAVNRKMVGDDRIMAFPSGCRGKTAEAALTLFGSLREVSQAEIHELLKVPKVGQKKAELIRRHFNRNNEEDEPSKEQYQQESLL